MPPLIFFDNDYEHVMNVKRTFSSVTSVHVDDKKIMEMRDYCNLPVFLHNQYAKYMKAIRFTPSDIHHGVSHGMTEEHIQLLMDFVSRNPRGVAVFDWDRTISCIEGVYNDPRGYTSEMGIYKFNYPDTAQFIIGPNRIDMIRNMFDSLRRKGYSIYILTNNESARSARMRKIFLNVIRQVYPQMQDYQLLASNSAAGITKGAVLQKEINRLMNTLNDMDNQKYVMPYIEEGVFGQGEESNFGRMKRKTIQSGKTKAKKTKSRKSGKTKAKKTKSRKSGKAKKTKSRAKV